MVAEHIIYYLGVPTGIKGFYAVVIAFVEGVVADQDIVRVPYFDHKATDAAELTVFDAKLVAAEHVGIDQRAFAIVGAEFDSLQGEGAKLRMPQIEESACLTTGPASFLIG